MQPIFDRWYNVVRVPLYFAEWGKKEFLDSDSSIANKDVFKQGVLDDQTRPKSFPGIHRFSRRWN